MIKEIWNSWNTRQKIVLTIYIIISLPTLPLNGIIIPFLHWLMQSDGVRRRKLSLPEFLSMSVTNSIFIYVIAVFIFWCPK